MQHRRAHQLDVEVAQAQRALGGLAHDREGLGQEVVERLAVLDPLAELVGLGAELVVGQRGELLLPRVDLADGLARAA